MKDFEAEVRQKQKRDKLVKSISTILVLYLFFLGLAFVIFAISHPLELLVLLGYYLVPFMVTLVCYKTMKIMED